MGITAACPIAVNICARQYQYFAARFMICLRAYTYSIQNVQQRIWKFCVNQIKILREKVRHYSCIGAGEKAQRCFDECFQGVSVQICPYTFDRGNEDE